MARATICPRAGGTDASKFQGAVQAMLEPGMSVCQTTGSAAIRIEVPAFRIPDGLEVGLPKMRIVLAAAAKLAGLFLDDAALKATPAGLA